MVSFYHSISGHAGQHVSNYGPGAHLPSKPVQRSGPTKPFTKDEVDFLKAQCARLSHPSSCKRVKKPGTKRKTPSDLKDSVHVQNFDTTRFCILDQFNQIAEAEIRRKMSRWAFDKYVQLFHKTGMKETHKCGTCLGLPKYKEESAKLMPAFPCCVALAGDFVQNPIARLMGCPNYHDHEVQSRMLNLLENQKAVYLHRNLNKIIRENVDETIDSLTERECVLYCERKCQARKVVFHSR